MMWEKGVAAAGVGIFIYHVVEACISLTDYILYGAMITQ